MWNWSKTEITLSLIRHGKTLANQNHLYCGSTDIELSKDGILQLENLKYSIQYPVGDIYFTSGLKRTNQTLNILYGNVDKIQISNISEMDFGIFEMKNYNQLKNIPSYINWISNIKTEKCPGGESQDQFNNRIHLGFDEIINIAKINNKKNCIVVTHGGVIANVMDKLFPNFFNNNQSFYKWQPSYGRGYCISLGNNLQMVQI